MPEPAEQTAHNDRAASQDSSATIDWPVMLATYLGAMLVFYPLIRWLFRMTEASEQLFHALIVLAAAGFFLLLEKRRRLRLVLEHDQRSITLLAASFVLVAVSLFMPVSKSLAVTYIQAALLLAAFGLTLASLVRFTLGPQIARSSQGFIIAFGIFMLLALALPVIDWPLRTLAGKWSMSLLSWIGQGAHLQLVNLAHDGAPARPELVLSVAGRPFIVAAECNGFGLLSSSLLLTTLLGVYRKLQAFDFFLVIVLAMVTAFIANTLRILVIVLLAPRVENYMLMHEVVGLICFYGALAFLWWFVYGFGVRSKPKPA